MNPKLRLFPEILWCPAWFTGLLELAYKEMCKQFFNVCSGGMIPGPQVVFKACKHEGEEPTNLIGLPAGRGGSWRQRGCGCLCVVCRGGGAGSPAGTFGFCFCTYTSAQGAIPPTFDIRSPASLSGEQAQLVGPPTQGQLLLLSSTPVA